MKNRLCIIFLTFCFIACSPRALHEAEDVVRTADSLCAAGQMYGIDTGDSATLAQAYETFGTIPLPFRKGLGLGSLYAHACYHYGRLLREKDNPVAAMECFINASHTRTRDYHILGRVYSNMGDLCHLAGEYQLAYDMYQRSADMFLQDGDTIAFYYGLYNMAFEKAELADSCVCSSLLSKIVQSRLPLEGRALIPMTLAELQIHCHNFDDAIYWAREALSYDEKNATSLVLLAQAYSYKDIQDSAVYYANLTIEHSHELWDKNNVMYILANEDSTKDIEEVRRVASDRSDIQKIIEIQQSKFAQAVQLLELDMARKPNFAWLYAIIATLLVVGCSAGVYIYRKHQKHQTLSQYISDLEYQNKKTIAQMRAKVEERCALYRISQHITKDLCWNDFDRMCQIVDQQFFMIASKLRHKQILNETEVRLCILVLINLDRTGISATLPYSLSGVGKLKDQTSKKIGTTGKKLHDFLLKLAVEG